MKVKFDFSFVSILFLTFVLSACSVFNREPQAGPANPYVEPTSAATGVTCAEIALPEEGEAKAAWSNASAILVYGPAAEVTGWGERWVETSPGNWELTHTVRYTFSGWSEVTFVNLQFEEGRLIGEAEVVQVRTDWYNDVTKYVKVCSKHLDDVTVVLFEHDQLDALRSGWAYVIKGGTTKFVPVAGTDFDVQLDGAVEIVLPAHPVVP